MSVETSPFISIHVDGMFKVLYDLLSSTCLGTIIASTLEPQILSNNELTASLSEVNNLFTNKCRRSEIRHFEDVLVIKGEVSYSYSSS